MPKVSIITPLYNGSNTLTETVESVLIQDYYNWEWILFDDGSTDGTQDIAKKLIDIYKGKIFYFEHKSNANHGTAYTRNRAIEKSNGELISFIDQDDVWNKNRLSYQINIFDKMNECSMIWGPALYWYKDRSFKQPVGSGGKGLKSGVYNPPEFVDLFLKDLRGTPLPGSTLLRRKYFDEVNGFEECIKGSEDIVLWIKLAEKYSIYYDDEILIKYRKHQGSTLRQAAQSGKMDEWNLTFYRWVIGFLKNNSRNKILLEEYEFLYYKGLKRIAAKKNYIGSRKYLLNGLKAFPELKKRYYKDFLLDLILPFNIATKISSRIRFDLFKQNEN